MAAGGGAILQICHSHRRLFEQTDPARNLSSSRPCLLICHHLFDLLPGFQKELLNIGPKRYNKIETDYTMIDFNENLCP